MNENGEEGRMGRSTEDVAALLRAAIEAGEYAPGTALPASEELAQRFKVSRQTAQKAVRQLAEAGWLRTVRRQRPVVVGPPGRRSVIRRRRVHRDERGYFFDLGAQEWRPVEPPTRGVGKAPEHIAELLGTRDAFYRDRLMGPAGATYASQVTTSYIPLTLVGEIHDLGAEDTGPGGIYDRIEEHFDCDLEWEEDLTSRRATPADQRALRLSATSLVLAITRRAWIETPGGERTVEVNDIRMDATRFTVRYRLERDESAKRGRR